MAQGKTFTGQLFLGTATTDASIQSGTALPIGGNPGDLFLLDVAGVGSLHIYNGSAWVQANTGGGAAGAAGEVQYSDGSGNFQASSGLFWDTSTNDLYVYGDPKVADQYADLEEQGLFLVDHADAENQLSASLLRQQAFFEYERQSTFEGYTGTVGFDTLLAFAKPDAFIIRSFDNQGAYGSLNYWNVNVEAKHLNLVIRQYQDGALTGGDLQINGNAGTSGQVLTSNGANNPPTWTTPAAAGITALTGDVTATGPGSTAASVVRLQGRDLANTAPNNGQVIKWNGTSSQWEPANDAAATPAGANTEIQFNNAGSFGASSSLTWSGTDLNVTGAVTVQSSVGTGVTTIDSVQVNVSDTLHTAQLSVVAGASVNVDLYVPVASAVVPAIVAADSGSTPVPLRLDASGVQIASAGVVGYTLPVVDGANGDVLTTDGAGNVAWAAVPGITSITGDVTATVAAGVATTTLAASGINASNNLGLLEISSSPTQSEVDNNAGFRCSGAGPFDLSAVTGADGRRLTFVNDRGNAVDITNGATSRTMSPDGGSTWVYSTAASKWFCTANV